MHVEPWTLLTVRAPLRTSLPSPVTSSISTTVSRKGPIRSRRGEDDAVAIVPPTVASSEASAGHSCPPSASTRRRSPIRIPPSTTASISAGSYAITRSRPDVESSMSTSHGLPLSPWVRPPTIETRVPPRLAPKSASRTSPCDPGGSDPRALRDGVSGVAGPRRIRPARPRRSRRTSRRRAAPSAGSSGPTDRTRSARTPARRGRPP